MYTKVLRFIFTMTLIIIIIYHIEHSILFGRFFATYYFKDTALKHAFKHFFLGVSNQHSSLNR